MMSISDVLSFVLDLDRRYLIPWIRIQLPEQESLTTTKNIQWNFSYPTSFMMNMGEKDFQQTIMHIFIILDENWWKMNEKNNVLNLIFLVVDEWWRSIDQDLDYSIDEHWSPYLRYVRRHSERVFNSKSHSQGNQSFLHRIWRMFAAMDIVDDIFQ